MINLLIYICCWNCCHSFETAPISIPMKDVESFKLWALKGVFCSFNCAKRYIMDNHRYDVHLLTTWTLDFCETILKMDLYAKVEGGGRGGDIPSVLRAAPSRKLLKMFGYKSTISFYLAYHHHRYLFHNL